MMELQTRESEWRCSRRARCPSEHLETQQSPVVLVVIQAPAVVSDSLCAENVCLTGKPNSSRGCFSPSHHPLCALSLSVIQCPIALICG